MDSTPLFPLSLPPCSPAPSVRFPFRHYSLFFHKGKGRFCWPREGGSRATYHQSIKRKARMASKTHRAFLLLSAVMASLVAGSTAGVYHIVGAGKGWRMAPNKTYYEDWAHTRNISVGDKLMFLYRSGVYNIVEVPTKELLDACSMSNITNRYQNGPTIIELTQPGPHYYFCGVGEHCEAGQKLAINVSAVAPPPPDAPSTSSAAAAGARAVMFYSAGLAACLVSTSLI